MLIAFTKKTAGLLWGIILALIVITGLFTAAGQIASPYLADFKSEIEQATSELIGANVKIGDIRSHWRTFGPLLELQNVEISRNGDRASKLLLNKIDAEISLVKMLTQQIFTPDSLIFHGIELDVTRETDGSFSFGGISQQNDQKSAQFSIEPLLQIPNLQLKNTQIHWQDKTSRTAPVDLKDIQLRFINDNNRHQLTLALLIPAEPAQRLRISADITTESDNYSDWSGQIYLTTENLQLGKWLNPQLDQNYQLSSGSLDSRVWLTASHGEIDKIQGHLDVQNLKPELFSQNTYHISSQFNGRLQNQDWQLDLTDARIQKSDNVISSGNIHLAKQQDKLLLQADGINLDLLNDVSSIVYKDEDMPVDGIRGFATDVFAFYSSSDNNWFVESAVDGFGYNTVTNSHNDIQIPQISNLNAQITLSANSGHADIDAGQLIYTHSGLFRKSIPIKTLKGTLRWFVNADSHWQIESEQLQLNTADISTNTRLSLELDPQDPFIDLQMDFADADGSNASLYYPAGILSDPLTDWLDSAIVSGHVKSGSFVLYGPLNDYPFDKTHNGHFEVLFNAEQTILDYQQGWPRLEELSAEVRFHNNSLEINAFEGKLFNTDIIKASAFIEELDKTSPILINGETAGPASDPLRLLAETESLHQDFKSLTDNLNLNKDSRLKLDLAIPVEDHDQYRLDGEIIFNKNDLSLPSWDLTLNNLSGSLFFDLDGVYAKSLKGNFLGSTVNAKVSNDKINTFIKTPIHLTYAQIKSFLPDFPDNLMRGESDWLLTVKVPSIAADSNIPLTVTLSSDLQGTVIELPAPLNKSRDQQQPVTIVTSIQDKNNFQVALQVDSIFKAITRINGNPLQISAGHFVFGDSEEKLRMPDKKLILYGRVPAFDLQQWLDWLHQQPSNNASMIPMDVDLSLDSLLFVKQKLNNIELRGTTSDKTFKGIINADDIKGEFTIAGQNPIEAIDLDLQLAKLSINLDELDASTTDEPGSIDSFEPAASPDLNIKIKDFILNDNSFGNTVFRSSRGKDSMRLDEFRIDNDIMHAHAYGLWLKENDKQHSTLHLNLESDNLGLTLEQLGYTKQFENGVANIDGKLSWPGGPPEFSQKNLSGHLNINVSDGRILDFNPGVGRILGVLNLSAIQRRLSLDFSDLFREGFTFDEISANFDLLDGDAFTNNMVIYSTAGIINIAGRTGLRERDYDQIVSITPSIQSGLTIAGAVAGGPAGAAIGFLAQQLIGDKVDEAARTRYTVTGSWAEPKFVREEKKP